MFFFVRCEEIEFELLNCMRIGGGDVEIEERGWRKMRGKCVVDTCWEICFGRGGDFGGLVLRV